MPAAEAANQLLRELVSATGIRALTYLFDATYHPQAPDFTPSYCLMWLSGRPRGLSFFFQETGKNTSAYDAGKLKEEIRKSLNVRHLWQRIQEPDEHRPGLTPLTLLTLLLILNQGYLNYFIPYVGLGQLKPDATQISYFSPFLAALARGPALCTSSIWSTGSTSVRLSARRPV